MISLHLQFILKVCGWQLSDPLKLGLNLYSLRTITTISFCNVTVVLAIIAIIGGFFLPTTLCGLWPLAARQQETQPFELHASFFQSIAQRTQAPISQFISHRTDFSAEFLIFVSAV